MLPLPIYLPEHGRVELPLGERVLVRLAVDLGAATSGGPLAPAEQALVDSVADDAPSSCSTLARVRAELLAGRDPLGDTLCRLRPPKDRRSSGAFYTPQTLVAPMLEWSLAHRPERVVDPGCGSGRFTLAAARGLPSASLVAIDNDPLATLLTRAGLAVLGVRSATVMQADYTAICLPEIEGRTAFVGNPPYVRHHELSAELKVRAATMGKLLGHPVSGLTGLHAYFFLATAMLARQGDVGCFITSSEWLDVGYGSLIRDLLLNGLGGTGIHVISATAAPFEEAMVTGAVTCFEVGAAPATLRVRYVESSRDVQDLTLGIEIPRGRFIGCERWTPLVRVQAERRHEDQRVPLGHVVRVHRGIVTGANSFFLLSRREAADLGIAVWCRPAITSAEEILTSGGIVRDRPERRLLLDIPKNVDRREHPALDAYLRRGEEGSGGQPVVADGYVASRRRPWWHLGRKLDPPIVVSYMARQAPVFALNPDRLRLVNIAHGLYPVQDLTEDQLAALVTYLNRVRDTFRGGGRTYHGGLEKFEPSELEALPIPASGPWN